MSAPPSPTAAEPVHRVRQPPGGTSTISLAVDDNAQLWAQTQRAPPSGRVPPGGHETYDFPEDVPKGRAVMEPQQYLPSFRAMPTVEAEAVKAAESTPARSTAKSTHSAEAVLGAEAATVPRIQPPTPSVIVFTEDGALYPDALPEKKPVMSVQKQRELAGSAMALFLGGEEKSEPEPEVVPEEVPGMVPADKKYIQGLTVQELRVVLRERKLNPAGSQGALVERLLDSIAGGAPPLMIAPKQKAGGMTSTAISNNYARNEGQNMGNFLTERPSTRVGHHPGGASQIVFGEEAPAQAPPHLRTVPQCAAKVAEMNSSVFAQAAEAGEAPDSPTRASLAQSSRKRAEQAGSSIFEPCAQAAGHITDGKLMELMGTLSMKGEAAEQQQVHVVPVSDNRVRELAGHNAVNPTAREAVAEEEAAANAKKRSDAKQRELEGVKEFYTGGTDPVVEPVKLSGMKAMEISGTIGTDMIGVTKEYRPGTARLDGRAKEFGSRPLFTPEEAVRRELSQAQSKKVAELSGGGVIFSDNLGRVGRPSTRVLQAPGGASQILFG